MGRRARGEGPGATGQQKGSLADAQRNKYRRMCELAKVSADDHVLEIGTGWGGFAMFAAGTYGCRVPTITISKEQHALATERIKDAGVAELIDVKLMDYRDVQGTFDAIVSIEMFEAVGAGFFQTVFAKSSSVLKPGGRLALQVIHVAGGAVGEAAGGLGPGAGGWRPGHVGDPAGGRGATSGSRCPTRASGWTRGRRRRSSSRSSRRSRSTALGSVSGCRTASCRDTAAR